MSDTIVQRQPQGVRTGGQFAPSAKSEGDVTLDGDEPQSAAEALCWEYAAAELDTTEIVAKLDEQNAEIVAMKERAKAEGRSFWRPGQRTNDRHQKELRDALPPKQREIYDSVKAALDDVVFGDADGGEVVTEVVPGFEVYFDVSGEDGDLRYASTLTSPAEYGYGTFTARRNEATPAWIDFESEDNPEDGVNVLIVDPRKNPARTFEDGF